MRGSEKVDRCGRGDRDGIVRVARRRECAVGQREYDAAMTHAVPIEHVRPHGHAQTGGARPDFFDPEPETSRGVIAREERLRGKLRDALRLWIRRERFHDLRDCTSPDSSAVRRRFLGAQPRGEREHHDRRVVEYRRRQAGLSGSRAAAAAATRPLVSGTESRRCGGAPRSARRRAHAGRLYDLQWEKSEITLFDSPTSGNKVARSFMMPKTREEPISISRAVKVWEVHTFGMVGRVPDYIDRAMTGYAAGAPFLAEADPRFGANAVRAVRPDTLPALGLAVRRLWRIIFRPIGHPRTLATYYYIRGENRHEIRFPASTPQ